MGRKIDRFPLTIILCGLLGVILGATASQAEMNQCLTTDNPTSQCLNQNPIQRRIEGMGMGLFAGAGAAVAATWQRRA